ncbi:carbonic anhydrase [Methanocella arvoryzae]|uniref:carbonic anhydrase n=1 Tax=Methanocella arvoryzae (strain DSM 22066 / NBRC 105507 / MRE50) TaxID=351160 RepID=Q0W2B0_METAR|nr:carbonic anhydrase [Methanocella arvoryzae]CAJ37483.1 putative carbonic anhydrase [Methanocella arvoryzae MRE50]
MQFKSGVITLIDKLEYNDEYAAEVTRHGKYDEHLEAQTPDITLVTCSDSRVLEKCLDDEIGKIFSIKNIGNRVMPNLGSIEYGTGFLKTPLLIILGHTGCGAIHASMSDISNEHTHVTKSLESIRPTAANIQKLIIRKGGIAGYMKEHLPNPDSHISEQDYLETLVTEANVDRQVDILLDDEPIRKLVYDGKLMIIGAIYDFKDIYSPRRGSIFIINVNGETDVNKLKVVDFLSDERLITDRMKRLLQY